jgi:hypothetical protein
VDGVRIIKADEAFAIRCVQRQRITEAVGALTRRLHALNHEFDPVITNRVYDEHHAIERKKMIQPWIELCFDHRV